VNALAGPRLTGRLAVAGVAALLGFFVFVPLCSIAFEALRAGWPAAAATFADPYARDAIGLTLLAAAVTIVVNGAFGVLSR
jgi:sulfate transport system permease protein